MFPLIVGHILSKAVNKVYDYKIDLFRWNAKAILSRYRAEREMREQVKAV